MKRCPTCNRTYADETLSFCLNDGKLLSAVYDPDETLVLGATDPAIRATKPDHEPENSTLTAFSQSEQPPSDDEAPGNTSPHLIYAGAGLIAVFVMVLVWSNTSSQTKENSVNPTKEQSTSTNSGKEMIAAPTALVPKRTTPRGEMQNAGQGPFYKNYNNTLEGGVAYKYANDTKVYLYDGNSLRPVQTERDFLDFYHCGTVSKIIDCAPIYEMPSSGNSPNQKNNVPTMRELQETLLKEAKRIEDEANR